jgi:putative ABC transport system substrate-binding protein
MWRLALTAFIVACSLSALAQRGAIPFIGFLNSGSPNERAHLVDAFRRGLKEGGYVDGKDIAIEYRWAEGSYERLPGLARELVERKVAVIVATGGNMPALAAKSATSTIPIVFTGGVDPVKLGLVASLSRPGGNVTGVANISASLQAKRLQLLREIVPGAAKIVYLVNPKGAAANTFVKEIEAAAESMGAKIEVLSASSESEIDAGFAAMKKIRANALLVAADPFFLSRRDQIAALAVRHRIPACYSFREYTAAGGLMSYGADIADGYRQAGVYATRILKGAKPADLPVIQLTKFELIVNLKTAKKLGLHISRDFLARVDEVIQ